MPEYDFIVGTGTAIHPRDVLNTTEYMLKRTLVIFGFYSGNV